MAVYAVGCFWMILVVRLFAQFVGTVCKAFDFYVNNSINKIKLKFILNN